MSIRTRSNIDAKNNTHDKKGQAIIEEQEESDVFPKRDSPLAKFLSSNMKIVNDKLQLFRHYMMIPWLTRSIVTIVVVCLLSLLEGSKEIIHVDALTAKDSVLNQVFVKMGWAWTISSLLAFNLSLLPLRSDKLKGLANIAVRTILTTAVFHLFCQVLFPLIENWTGICTSKGVVVSQDLSKKKCLKKGYDFFSFDISGHSYLMIYCTLTLMEESRAFKRYISMGNALQKLRCNEQDIGDESVVSTEEARRFKSVYTYLWPVISVCYLCVCMLCLTWDSVLVITTVYYHTLLEKFLGVILGALSFSLLYGVVFKYLNVI